MAIAGVCGAGDVSSEEGGVHVSRVVDQGNLPWHAAVQRPGRPFTKKEPANVGGSTGYLHRAVQGYKGEGLGACLHTKDSPTLLTGG